MAKHGAAARHRRQGNAAARRSNDGTAAAYLSVATAQLSESTLRLDTAMLAKRRNDNDERE